jgi:hypothetical protein
LLLAAALLTLSLPVQTAVNTTAEQPVAVRCDYAARDGTALALPAYQGLRAVIYAKPWVCREANRLARGAKPTPRNALALLVLTHEAIHIRGVKDEALTECLAAREVTETIRLVRPDRQSELEQLAQQGHRDYLAKRPAMATTC